MPVTVRRLPRLVCLILVCLIATLGLLWLPAGPAAAQGAPGSTDSAFAAQITGWQKVLDKAASSLLRTNLSEADYETLHKALGDVFDQARKASAEAAATVEATHPMLEALGKPPADGAPAEAETVTTEREQLQETLTRFDGRMRQSDLVATRADILLRTTNERRINQFAETLFLRGVSPLAPETFQQVSSQAQFLRDRVLTALNTAQAAGLPKREHGIQFAVLGVLALVVGWLTRRHVVRRFGQRDGIEAPSYRQRVTAAAAEALARGLLPSLVIAAAAYVALEALNGLPLVSVIKAIIESVASGLIAFFFVAGLGRALLAARRPCWRLLALEDGAARRLARRFMLFTLVLALAGTVLAFLEVALVPPELHAVTGLGAKLLGALALLALVLPDRLWQSPASDDNPATVLAPRLRALAALVAVATAALAVLRYHNFSLYIAEMTLAGTALAGQLLLLRGVCRELISLIAHEPANGADKLRGAVFHSEQDVRIFQFFACGMLDLLLMVIGAALLLPLSGIAWSEVSSWGKLFLHGVRIGEVTLSPVDIASALVLVAVIMALTRFLQRKLDDQVLQHLQFDRGVRHSIRTGIGYFGAATAILVGIGTVGLNLSNLALIAGALSVGIGFGLQAIVSNFVAGLILLVERPIKVGDWIVIGGDEGVVKRISVRATEIQTFQHASVIIPNSELIAKAVKNWTYKDKFGRIDIAVGVSYGSDPVQVRDVLIACAKAEPRVSVMPPPNVVLRNFGDNALEFELRCFVADIEAYRAAATDLRFSILREFREKGIDMPAPQRELHCPALDRIAELLAKRQNLLGDAQN